MIPYTGDGVSWSIEKLATLMQELFVREDLELDEVDQAIQHILIRNYVPFFHQYELSNRTTVNYLVEGHIGLCLITGATTYSTLIERLIEYAENKEVGGLIVILKQRVNLPECIQDKPVIDIPMRETISFTDGYCEDRVELNSHELCELCGEPVNYNDLNKETYEINVCVNCEEKEKERLVYYTKLSGGIL